MALEIPWERQDGIAIAILADRIDGDSAGEFQSQLESGVGSEDQALILDFERISYINSSGLRVGLRLAWRRCSAPRKARLTR